MKRVLFNHEQVMRLAKDFQNSHESEDMDDYSHGVVDGIEFILFLYERCEK